MVKKNESTAQVFEFSLVKKAAKSGGDRYATEVDGVEWTVYFPQSISRKEGDSAKSLKITVG